MFHVKRRWDGLRIARFPASGKTRSLRHPSSSKRNRRAGLCLERTCGVSHPNDPQGELPGGQEKVAWAIVFYLIVQKETHHHNGETFFK